MSEYRPDKWHIIGTDDSEVWKVLSGWSGGYLDGDSWRLSSGILKIEEDDDYYLIYNHSGSLYKCHKQSEGFTGYSGSVFSNFKKKLADKKEEELKVYKVEDWIKRGKRI